MTDITNITNTPLSNLTINDLVSLAVWVIVLVVLIKGIHYAIFHKSIEKAKTKEINEAWAKEAIQNGVDPEWVKKMNE